MLKRAQVAADGRPEMLSGQHEEAKQAQSVFLYLYFYPYLYLYFLFVFVFLLIFAFVYNFWGNFGESLHTCSRIQMSLSENL